MTGDCGLGRGAAHLWYRLEPVRTSVRSPKGRAELRRHCDTARPGARPGYPPSRAGRSGTRVRADGVIVAVTRKGHHPITEALTVKGYAARDHVLVSPRGASTGALDRLLGTDREEHISGTSELPQLLGAYSLLRSVTHRITS